MANYLEKVVHYAGQELLLVYELVLWVQDELVLVNEVQDSSRFQNVECWMSPDPWTTGKRGYLLLLKVQSCKIRLWLVSEKFHCIFFFVAEYFG